MQRKLTLQWCGGIVEVENNRVVVRQGSNVISIDLEQEWAFITDIEAAFDTLPPPEPTSGYGGTVAPIAPKKTMQQIVDEIENAVQPHV
jgi:hypothetical protein